MLGPRTPDHPDRPGRSLDGAFGGRVGRSGRGGRGVLQAGRGILVFRSRVRGSIGESFRGSGPTFPPRSGLRLPPGDGLHGLGTNPGSCRPGRGFFLDRFDTPIGNARALLAPRGPCLVPIHGRGLERPHGPSARTFSPAASSASRPRGGAGRWFRLGFGSPNRSPSSFRKGFYSNGNGPVVDGFARALPHVGRIRVRGEVPIGG